MESGGVPLPLKTIRPDTALKLERVAQSMTYECGTLS